MPDDHHYEARKLAWQAIQNRKDHAFQLQGEYGKWLIASLLLVHGTTFAVLAQDEHLSKTILPHVYWPVVAGLLLAMVCGFSTWINWTLVASLYEDASAWMVVTVEHYPKFDGWEARWINFTLWLSIASGMLSAVMILVAALIGHGVMDAPNLR